MEKTPVRKRLGRVKLIRITACGLWCSAAAPGRVRGGSPTGAAGDGGAAGLFTPLGRYAPRRRFGGDPPLSPPLGPPEPPVSCGVGGPEGPASGDSRPDRTPPPPSGPQECLFPDPLCGRYLSATRCGGTRTSGLRGLVPTPLVHRADFSGGGGATHSPLGRTRPLRGVAAEGSDHFLASPVCIGSRKSSITAARIGKVLRGASD
jgi:hypothetical protein